MKLSIFSETIMNTSCFFLILLLLKLRTTYAQTCSGDSCGWHIRKFTTISNAESNELISDDVFDWGKILIIFRFYLTISHKNYED